jgi:hypothetical protein
MNLAPPLPGDFSPPPQALITVGVINKKVTKIGGS